MYTGLEKVIKPKQIVITIDLNEEVTANIGDVVRRLADRLDGTPLVQGGAGNVGFNEQTVGLWVTK